MLTNKDLDVFEIFRQVPFAMCIIGIDNYKLEYANNYYFLKTGINKSAIGQPVFEIFPAYFTRKYIEIFENIILHAKPFNLKEFEFNVDSGNKFEKRFLNCNYQPIILENGSVIGIIIIFVDVTDDVLNKKESLLYQESLSIKLEEVNFELIHQIDEKVKLVEELVTVNKVLFFENEEKNKRGVLNRQLKAINYSEKLESHYARSLIEASFDPLFVINLKGKITDMNNASVKVTGYTREQLKDTDFCIYFTEPKQAKKGYLQVFKKGFIADYSLVIKDQKLTDVLINGSVFKDEQGIVIGAVFVARDFTEQKTIEKELIKAKVFAELAAIIAEEAKSKAEEATKIANDAVKAKQQFLSNMSHEIRTPMNTIIGFTKVVLKTELTPKQIEYLMAIKMSGDALILLINDILDLAKVDAGRMVFEKTPFKLADSISAMLHLFEHKINEKNLLLIKEFDHHIPEVLLGDSLRLHQIILNLLSNAVKFTSVGFIKLSVKMLFENDDKVVIEFNVSDTGIGITDSKKGKIFENFQQASSTTSRLYGGTGLGLAIVKQLVEGQNGSIHVESKIDMGSTFSFTLDFFKTNAKVELVSNILETDTEIKNIKVLVVEDIVLNQLLMRTILDDFGFECDIAFNGKIAIEKLQQSNYDIILMDLQMPEMNGFEATDYIRKNLNLKTPIIALTADVTTVDLAKCKALGMDDYVAKPINEKMLYNKIIGLVKKPTNIDSIVEYYSRNNLDGKAIYIDLSYLKNRTKSNPKLMMVMISLFLEQSTELVLSMKISYANKDWEKLYSTVHKMIPSFAIMGMSSEFENMAKKAQELAQNKQISEELNTLVNELENVFYQSEIEIQQAYNTIKNYTNEYK